MKKITPIGSVETKEEKMQQIIEGLDTLKSNLVSLIEEYETEGTMEEKADSLTEALDALEDAYEILLENE